MIDQLQSQALALWEKIHPQMVKPPRLSYLLQSRDHILIFWFEQGNKSDQPVLISKIPRTKSFNAPLEQSLDLLNRLRPSLTPPLVNTIPVRVFAGKVNELSHVVMTAMPGEPIMIPGNNRLGRRTVLEHLSAFQDWLTEFQSQTYLDNQVYDFPGWQEIFARQRRETFSAIPQAGQFQQISGTISRRLANRPIPCTWGYGDAHHSNILLQNGKVSGIIDWVGVQQSQWFFIDWYYFIFFYALEFFKKNQAVDRQIQLRMAISTTMGIKEHWLADIFQEKTRQFLAVYAFDPDLNPDFLLAFLQQLYWPREKARLIQEAFAIYNQRPSRSEQES
ncbi:MAG: phosphotransferase [Chloroflexota bacterium]|nr:MAG: phosphotransferase [Chloroflexota bacterium]